MKTFLLTISALAIAVPAFAEDTSEEVSMDDVPEAAMATAQANAQGIEFEEVLFQIEDGVEMYEFIGTKADGLGFGVEVFPDGTLWETAEEITLEEVTPEAAAVFAAEMPGVEPLMIEKNTRDDGALIVYEMEIEMDGEKIEAEVNADGSNFVNLGPGGGVPVRLGAPPTGRAGSVGRYASAWPRKPAT